MTDAGSSGGIHLTDHRKAEPDAQDRIIDALQDLDIGEQKMFVKALDRHAAGECSMEQALADFVQEVLKSRGAYTQ